MSIEQQRRDLVSTTARLVEFLRDLARTGKSTIRDLAGYGSVRWLVDAPVGIDIDTSASNGDVLLSINPVPSEPPPSPPASIAEWIRNDDLHDSSLEAPELSEEMPPDRRTAQAILDYNEWVDRWLVWAESDRLLAHRREWFKFLAHAHRLLDQQDDIYELVLGTGVLTWRRPDGLIRHPLLTTRVDLVSDPVTGRIDVIVGHDAVTRICDRQLLDDEPSFKAGRAESLRDELRSSPPDPLSDEIKGLLERWRTLALDRARPYEHTWNPCESADADPDLRFSPVLILRERDRTSLIDYYDRMLAALSGPDAVAPLGLAQLLTALEPDERLAWLEAEGAADAQLVGSDPLFPLASNPEQRQIIERLGTNSGVVVMGPPGTGKTHTIANLLCALLARGQRVLVTSQKAQALRVLRDKLPAEVQNLCVSMTDVKRGGSDELDASVTALSDRYASFNEATYRQHVQKALADRHAARTRVAELTERLREIREAETVLHPPIAEGYEGTLAHIAQRLRAGRASYAWIPLPFPDDAPFEAPLSSAEFEELRGLLVTQTPQRAARANQVLPDLATIPTAAVVRSHVAAEGAATTAARRAATELSEQLRLLDEVALGRLRELLTKIVTCLQKLGLPPDPSGWPDDWRTRAIADGLAGRETSFWSQLAQVAPHAHEAQAALESIGLRQVALPVFEPAGPNSFLGQLQAAQALRAHLEAGKELKKRFKPAVQRQAERLLEGATVDGVHISNLATLDVVLARMTAENIAAQLAVRWAAAGVTLDRSLPLQRAVAQLVDRANELAAITKLIETRDEIRGGLASLQVALALATPTEVFALLRSLDAVEARIEAERATAAMNDLAERLELDARHPAAPPELAELAAALAGR
ncbi:MAG TPA: AAA domain-containing protein, partial [Acidimicrobiales bacterium]